MHIWIKIPIKEVLKAGSDFRQEQFRNGKVGEVQEICELNSL